MTDDVTHLRTLLAEQTARADGLDQQLSAVLAGIKRNTKVMNGDNHLIAIAKAQQARAEKAEAACAEMRAALEAIDRECLGYKTWAFEARAAVEAGRALLSRPDLGVGKVLVAGPLDALVDNLVRVVCDCHDGSDLWAHTRRDPEAFRRAVRGALLKKGGG